MAKNNIVTFGLRNVHYSSASTTDGESWTYETPVALPGAQEFSSQLIGGTTNVNADDTIVHQLVSNSGRTITLTLTELTDEFKKNILGYKETTEGNLVEITNSTPVTFALGFEIQGDVKARRVWYFLCTATPVSESTKTKGDSAEANAIQLTITARPIKIDDDNYTSHVIAYKGDSNYDTFLESAPVLPSLKASSDE